MSVVSASNEAAGVDWNIVATAVAVFIGTLITTIWGWQARRRRLDKAPDNPYMVTGAVIQDNQSLRESTIVSRELRDQLLLLNHAIVTHCRALEENTNATDELLREVKDTRRLIEDRFRRS